MLLYHGIGETRIPSSTFEQLEKDSDRAAGIVAGSILEQRLTEYLQKSFPTGQPTERIIENRFHSSAPLGTFSIKIDLAYLLRLINEQSHKDLSLIKDIRNRFAHRLEIDSFAHDEIKSRCENLVSIDQWLREPTQVEIEARRGKPFMKAGDPPIPGLEPGSIMLAFGGGVSKLLKDPRYRYVQTALLFSFAFGARADGFGHAGYAV